MPYLVDVKTLAERLAVSERTIYDLVRDGEIPYIRVGRLLRFDPEKVLMHLTVSPSPMILEIVDAEEKSIPYIRPPKRKKGKRINWKHPYFKTEG